MKHLAIPIELREPYKRAAFTVYNAIAGDCPGLEDERQYSRRAVVEIVRDANRISTLGLESHTSKPDERQALKAWLKEHEYDQAYRRDMDRAVIEAIYRA